MFVLLTLLLVLVSVLVLNSFLKKTVVDVKPQLKDLEIAVLQFDVLLAKMDGFIKDEFQRNRKEFSESAKNNREELSKSLEGFSARLDSNIKVLGELLTEKHKHMQDQQTEFNKRMSVDIKELKESVEKQLLAIQNDNTKQLDEMRKTVDEKLQKTLNDRLSQSFEVVGKQLQAVQEGLGEMKTIATDVGGLKRVLSNVKIRGAIGEVQLAMLLEQILAPDQYEANVKTNPKSNAFVEFAIKLPGKEDVNQCVWLPIDAKFPKDKYEQLQDAYDDGDLNGIEEAQKNLENTIKTMAKDIQTKYIDPPNTTDFAIMFLPFEGIYAEVVRKAALLDELQNKYKVIVTGPTTFAAILNSLQMGFRSLAIQKRSSEVWTVLSEVKAEFEKFGGLLQKAKDNIQSGLNNLDKVVGTRTRAIQRKLQKVESLSVDETPTELVQNNPKIPSQ